MKTLKFALMFVIMGFVSHLLAADASVEKPTDYSDKFMELLYQKAVKYSDKGEIAVEKTVDFVSEQAEPTIREYIVWSIIGHLWDGLPWIIAFTGGLGTVIIFWKWANFGDYPSSINVQGIFVIIGVIASLFGFFGTFLGEPHRGTSAITDIKLATQAYFAPRAYIIKNFSDYVKEISKK